MTAPKEVPFLFDAESVRGILDGRKTQTRRIIKPQPIAMFHLTAKNCKVEVGSVLWVKETFCNHSYFGLIYRADKPKGAKPRDNWEEAWTPSIFMPKALCRIRLRCTAVKFERLQSISFEDCLAEGMDQDYEASTKAAYAVRWEAIHGKGSWQKNPWVFAYTFERLT